MVYRMRTVRNLRRLPADLAKAAMIAVSMLLPFAIVVGVVTG